MIVSQWHCELPSLHCSQCLPLLSPRSLFPAPCCSVPLGLKTDTKRQPRPNIDWVSGPQPSPSARHRAPERPLLFRSYSAAHSRLLAVHAERQTERRRRRESVHKLSEVGQEGDYNRRDSTVTGVRETSSRGQRLRQGNTIQAMESWGGVRTSVSTLRKCQSQKASKRPD